MLDLQNVNESLLNDDQVKQAHIPNLVLEQLQLQA